MNDFLSDAVPIPESSFQDKVPNRFVYRGPSMAPTFRLGQILQIHTEARDIVPGDVIVFHEPNGDGIVVHRVISVSPDGLITRGDNNTRNDPALIAPDQIFGRVEKTDFRGQIRPVAGGWRGLRKARILHATLRIKIISRRTFSRPYHWLKRSGIVAKLWRPEISTMRFETQDGLLIKYIHKGRTVASCWPDSNRWWFRRPYDFILGSKVK